MSIIAKSPVAQLDADIATLQVILEESVSAVESNGLPARNYNLVQEIVTRWSSFSSELGQLSGRINVVMVRLVIDILLSLKAEMSAKWISALVVVGLLSGHRVSTLADIEEAVSLAKANFSALPGIKADDVLNMISEFKLAFPNYVMGSRKIRGLTGTADFYDAVRSDIAKFLGSHGPDSVALPLKVPSSSLLLPAVSLDYAVLRPVSNYIRPIANLVADEVVTITAPTIATITYDNRVFATGADSDTNSPQITLPGAGVTLTILNATRARLFLPVGTEITFRNGLTKEAKLYFDNVVTDLPAGFYSAVGDGTLVKELVGTPRSHWSEDFSFVSVATEYLEYLRTKGIAGLSLASYFARRFADVRNPSFDDPVALSTDADIAAFVNAAYPACPGNDAHGITGLIRGTNEDLLLRPDYWLGDEDVRVGGVGTYSVRTKRKMYDEYINLIVWLVEMAASDGGFADR